MNELFAQRLENVNPDTRAEVRKNMTIEENSQRAESLYPDNPEFWAVYTAAARDQQQIDTDKACEWLKKHLGDGNGTPEFIKAFRKAMED